MSTEGEVKHVGTETGKLTPEMAEQIEREVAITNDRRKGSGYMQKDSEMKVYRMNDYDWVAARSLNEAVAFLCELVELSADEATDAPRELTTEDMERLVFTHEDGRKSSFSEHLQETTREPGRGMEPFFFASTEY